MKKVTAALIAAIIFVTCIQLPSAAFALGNESETTVQTQTQEGSSDPSDPVNPTDPTGHEEPTKPTEPEEPTDPTKPTEPAKPVLPKRLTFDKTKLTLARGKKAKLKLRVEPSNAVLNGKFTSSNSKVASVNGKGEVTARSKGTAYIYYTAGNGVKASCKVTVIILTKKVTLNAKNIELLYDKKIKKGFTFKLTYKIDKGAYNKVKFATSNRKIAVVSSKGVITPKKAGTARITVTAEGGAKAVCTVVVKDNGNTWISLNQVANRAAIKYASTTRYIYGKSVQGRPLEAYIIKGKNSKKSKVLFMDFACHGFEDDYYRDGKVLVNLGNQLVDYYAKHTGKLGKYTLVIIPCANPDGTIAGKNNLRACKKAFGRCTAAHVDMNRDFGNFKGKESRALRDFFKKYPPDIYLNFHGWLNTSIGTPWLAKRSSSKLKLNRVQAGSYGKGYIINYVKKKYKASVCLVEYKSPSSAKKSLGKTKSFLNSLMK